MAGTAKAAILIGRQVSWLAGLDSDRLPRTVHPSGCSSFCRRLSGPSLTVTSSHRTCTCFPIIRIPSVRHLSYLYSLFFVGRLPPDVSHCSTGVVLFQPSGGNWGRRPGRSFARPPGQPLSTFTKSSMTSEILICCGQTCSQLPHFRQAAGCLSSGIAPIAIGAMKPKSPAFVVRMCSL